MQPGSALYVNMDGAEVMTFACHPSVPETFPRSSFPSGCLQEGICRRWLDGPLVSCVGEHTTNCFSAPGPLTRAFESSELLVLAGHCDSVQLCSDPGSHEPS